MTTTIKEQPILFSAPMVRAILDGRKTMTRRVVKPQPNWSGKIACEWYEPTVVRRGVEEPGPQVFGFANEDEGWKCPYGSPGDRLWLRETFRPILSGWNQGGVDYRADDPSASGIGFIPWKPSIHMPRWASRITLQVEAVRVERLQEIAGQDARAEGCEPDWESFEEATCDKEGWDEPEEFDEECEVEGDWVNYGRRLVETHEHKEWELDRINYALRLAFRNLWESINGPESWDANPFVWVVTFGVVKP